MAAAAGAATRPPRTSGHGSRSTATPLGSGLDWNRVEIEQRIYEPERGKFTFDSPEMRILYRILDWNQKNGADVFFQQMWCNAAWLAYPEFRDDPVGRVHSAPADLDAFADGLATLMEHLVKNRGYTCIKWLCINNEPGADFSWWQAPPNKPLSIGPGLAAVRKALDKRGLKLPLSGPDTTTGGFPPSRPAVIDYLHLLGAYDFHDYGADFDFRTRGHIAAAGAERRGLGGNWPTAKASRSSFPSSARWPTAGCRTNPARAARSRRWPAANWSSAWPMPAWTASTAGAFSTAATWTGNGSSSTRGTGRRRSCSHDFPPHANSYFCLGLLEPFYGEALGGPCQPRRGRPACRLAAGVLCGAAQPEGKPHAGGRQRCSRGVRPQARREGLSQPMRLCRYRYGEAQRDRADVKVDPQKEFPLGPAADALRDTLPPNSLTIYSTYKLEHDAPGVIAE